MQEQEHYQAVPLRRAPEQFSSNKAEYAAKERAALELDGVNGKAKNRLLAVLRMERLVSEKTLAGFQHRVDNKGAVIFTLPGGGMIRDEGKELFFSARDETARHVLGRIARNAPCFA